MSYDEDEATSSGEVSAFPTPMEAGEAPKPGTFALEDDHQASSAPTEVYIYIVTTQPTRGCRTPMQKFVHRRRRGCHSHLGGALRPGRPAPVSVPVLGTVRQPEEKLLRQAFDPVFVARKHARWHPSHPEDRERVGPAQVPNQPGGGFSRSSVVSITTTNSSKIFLRLLRRCTSSRKSK
jgi:hypothetical protein